MSRIRSDKVKAVQRVLVSGVVQRIAFGKGKPSVTAAFCLLVGPFSLPGGGQLQPPVVTSKQLESNLNLGLHSYNPYK